MPTCFFRPLAITLMHECIADDCASRGSARNQKLELIEENPPQSPFFKGGGIGGFHFYKGGRVGGFPFFKGGCSSPPPFGKEGWGGFGWTCFFYR